MPSRPRNLSAAQTVAPRQERLASMPSSCRFAPAPGVRYAALPANVSRCRSASLSSTNPTPFGTFSHLWPSTASESARSSPATSAGGRLPQPEERSERTVRMQPQVVLLAHVGDRLDRVGGAGVDRADHRDHDRRLDAVGAVALDRLGEEVDAHGVAIVDRDRADAARAEPERAERLVVREVQLLRGVDGELGQRAHALLDQVHAVLAPEPVARDREADGVRHRRARAEVARRGRVAEQIGEPADRHLLELDTRGAERPHAGVLVDRRGPGLDDRRRRQRPARDVPEVAAAGSAGETARRARLEVAEDRLDRHAALRQRLGEARRELAPVDRDAGLRGWIQCGAEALGEVADGSVQLRCRPSAKPRGGGRPGAALPAGGNRAV